MAETLLPTLRNLIDLGGSNRRRFVFLFLLMLAGGIAEFATIGALIPFLAYVSGAGGNGSIVPAMILFAIVVLLAGAIRLALAWANQRFVAGIAHEATVDIQRRLLHQPYPFHLARNSSASVAALEQTQFAYSIIQQALQATAAVVLSAGIFAMLLIVEPMLVPLAGLAIGLLYVIAWRATAGPLARNSAALGGAYAERVQIVQEGAAGIRDVIIDQSQAPLIESLARADLRLAEARSRTALIAALPRIVIETLGILAIAVLALALAQRPGGLPALIPLLGALALGAQRMLPLVQQIFQAATMLSGNRSLLAEVAALRSLPMPGIKPAQAPLPFRHEIRLSGVSFQYPARAEPALRDIDLAIPAGAKVALVGPTGSGKSTLADLLMGLIEPSEGIIEVDGVALGPSGIGAWQQSIAHVPQAIFLADASIASNIALSGGDAPVDEQRLASAAQVAQLDAFIASLPEGYATRVGERGMALSGGQRQRLGVARAIYKGARLLILDEATSALDLKTEAALLAGLDRLAAKGTTVVIIAHRESSVAGCDLVIRLDEGRVTAVRPGGG